LRLLLRATAAVMLLALVALFMPRSWMAWAHEWLGLGKFPDEPIAEYLARLCSALYAAFGGLLLLTSADVWKYERAITYLALAFAGVSAGLAIASLRAGMPVSWLVADPLASGGFCGVTLLLQSLARKERRERPSG